MLASPDSQGAAGAASGFSARQPRAALKGGGAQRLAFAASFSGGASRPGECTGTVRIAADLDDFAVADGEDLAQALGWGRPGPYGRPGQGEAEHHGVAVDLHAFDGGAGAVGEALPVPVEDLGAGVAQPAPLGLGVQERSEQFEVEVAVSRLQMTGDVGHHPGTGRARQVVRVVAFGPGLVVGGDAVTAEQVDDL